MSTTESTEPPVEVASEVVDAAPKGKEVAHFDELARINAGLAALQKESDEATWDIDTTKGEEEARRFRKKCVTLRSSVDAAYERCNAPLLKSQREARDLVKKIQGVVEKIEGVWDAKITAKEQRKAAEKKAREEAEAARIAAIRTKIADLSKSAVSVAAGTAEDIQLVLDQLAGSQVTEEEFAEFIDEATAVWVKATRDLQQLHSAAVAREEEAARLARQREELAAEAQRQEQARQEQQRRDEAKRAILNVVMEITLGAVGKTSEAITPFLERGKALAAEAAALGDEQAIAAVATANEKITDMQVAAAEAERRQREHNKQVMRQNEEANAQFRRLEDSHRELVQRQQQHQEQVDAFAAEKAEASKAVVAEKEEVATGAAAELDRLSQETAANDPAPEVVQQTAAETAPPVEAAAPAVEPPAAPAPPADTPRPTDAELVNVVALTFGVSHKLAADWLSTFDASTLEIAA
jgi:hypothetical protein